MVGKIFLQVNFFIGKIVNAKYWSTWNGEFPQILEMLVLGSGKLDWMCQTFDLFVKFHLDGCKKLDFPNSP